MKPMTSSEMDDRNRRIVSMWVAGLDMEAIAATMKTTRGSITRSAHRMGLPHRRQGAYGRNLWPCVVHWAQRGWTAEQIADGIGIRGKAKQLLTELPP